MKIVLLEDAHLEANSMINELKGHVPDVSVEQFGTESQFRDRFSEFAANPPDLFILDQSLKWANPAPDLKLPPDDVRQGGPYRAGIRCAKMLSEEESTKGIPILLQTVLSVSSYADEIRDLPSVNYAEKRDAKRFLETIRSLLPDMHFPDSVFIVHGRDEPAKNQVAEFVRGLGLNAIILSEEANKGQTLIEKFEENSKVAFAIVLLTPDDVGCLKNADGVKKKDLKPRARQNVLLELGFFLAKLGRHGVCPLVKEIEIPSDLNGLAYVEMDESGDWRKQLKKEIETIGLLAG